MRVLYFTERDSPHDQRFLRALAETDHAIDSLRQFNCQPDTPAGVNEISWPEGQPDWSSWPGWHGGKRQLQTIIKSTQPDLVHAGPVQGPAYLAALAGIKPLVTMSWGSDLLVQAKRSPRMQYATCYTLTRTAVFIGDCQTVAEEAIQYGFPVEKIVKFPWGVDLSLFSPDKAKQAGSVLRRNLGWNDHFVVFCNRSWSPIYGVDKLAEAFVRAVQQNGNLRLLLAGDGPQSDKIHQILAPVNGKVEILGWLDHDALPGAYGAADLFVSPSHSDGTSISLMEAMACGCPVLVSDIPSNREWVEPGIVGEQFTDGDVGALKAKLLVMAVNPALPEYGQRARILAEERADWGKNFKKLLGAYEMAMSGYPSKLT